MANKLDSGWQWEEATGWIHKDGKNDSKIFKQIINQEIKVDKKHKDKQRCATAKYDYANDMLGTYTVIEDL